MYQNIGSGFLRSFKVSFGLCAGYGENSRNFTMDDAKASIHGWMQSRIEAGLPFLTGHLMAGQVVYAWPNGDGTSGKGDEPGGLFVGEVSVLYDADATDEEVVARLDELATAIGADLEQTRVYVAYGDKTWVLEKVGASTPTGD